jgi:hypothetical protein
LSDTTVTKQDLVLCTLLAGPILRRAEPKQVCIWIACSRPAVIRAEIFRAADLKYTKHVMSENKKNKKVVEPIGLGSSNLLRLGEHLYVGLVIAKPTSSIQTIPNANNNNSTYTNVNTHFPSNELLAYDVEFSYLQDNVKKKERLKDFGLLDGSDAIIYNNKHNNHINHHDVILLPTFFIQEKNNRNSLNVMYGSCRKLHGKGEDCLAIADKIIAASFEDLDRRPSVLYLIGDQIYADDVAGPLLGYLTKFGIQLLGREEKIWGSNKKLTEIIPGERQEFIEKHAKFTSESAANHLIGLGEFAAMYLLSWNIENWPKSFPDIRHTNHKLDKKKYSVEIEELKRTLKALPSVRRVLANIPTYMIFDDHEITDDWNITQEWSQAVEKSECGQQIVSNGFLAFWAFQAWGNDPSLYNEEFIARICEYLNKNGNVHDGDRKSFESFFWNFHGWTFTVPTYPLTIFVDTRTQRQYDSINGPPILINDLGLNALSNAAFRENYYKKGDPIIIVSPTPVFGFEQAEQLQEYLASKSNVYKWDLETWSSNEKGFVRFLTFLLTTISPGKCIFLSGDVHYGFTVIANFIQLQKEYKKEENIHRMEMPIVQLTSSALKTTSLSKEVLINEFLGRFSQLFSPRKTLRIGWANLQEKSQKIKHYKKSNRRNLINRLKFIVGFRKKQQKTQERIPPDWIESRDTIQPSGFLIPSLVVTDNNIGLVTLSYDHNNDIQEISHKLLVLKGNNIKVHEAKLS